MSTCILYRSIYILNTRTTLNQGDEEGIRMEADTQFHWYLQIGELARLSLLHGEKQNQAVMKARTACINTNLSLYALTQRVAAHSRALNVLIKQAVIKSQRQPMTPLFKVIYIYMSGAWLVFSRRADKSMFFCTVAFNSRSRDEGISTYKHVVCSLTLLFSAGTSGQSTVMNFSNSFSGQQLLLGKYKDKPVI